MPNAKVLSEKQAIVAALAERIKNAGAGILVDYRGITVLEDTALRAEMRKEGIDYSVVKKHSYQKGSGFSRNERSGRRSQRNDLSGYHRG